MASRKVSTYRTAPSSEVSKQKAVSYWEDKSSGDYVRETATQRCEAGSCTRYHTTTVGNRTTGEFSTVQRQQSTGGISKVVHQDNLQGRHTGYQYLED